MITTLFIISFIFCTAITVATILVGYRLVTTYSNAFLRSYYYYLISFYAFAYYGLWAQLLVRFGLSRITVDTTNLGTLTNFLPVLGVPFLYISWIMLVKMSTQLTNSPLSTKKELITHGAVLSVCSIMLVVLYLFVPETVLFSNNPIPVSSLSILLLLETIYFIVYFNGALNLKSSANKLNYFSLILLAGLVGRILLFVVTIYFELVLPLTITLYFLTNLIPLIFLWQIADEFFEPIHAETTEIETIERISKRFKITKREKDIIQQISLGKTNQQIADELFISLQTVKDHTHRIYKKTGVNSRMKLIRLLSE